MAVAPPESAVDFQSLFELAPQAHLVLAPDLTILGANQAYLDLVGMPRGELVGRYFFALFPDASGKPTLQQLRASFVRVLASGQPSVAESGPVNGEPPAPAHFSYERSGWSAVNTPVLDEMGAVVQILHTPVERPSRPVPVQPRSLVLRPLGDAHAASSTNASGAAANDGDGLLFTCFSESISEECRRLQQLLDNAPGFFCVLSGPDHRFEWANASFAQLVEHREVIGKTVQQALPELESQGFFDLLGDVYATGTPYIGRALPIKFQQRPGMPLIEKRVDFVYQPIVDARGDVIGIFVQGHDVSETHQLMEAVSHHAAHDALTGLANRRSFEQRVRWLIDQSRTGETEHCLLYLDLDQFKVVNDTFGHVAGDAFLCRVADLLRHYVGTADTLARLGGDEFAMLLQDCSSQAAQRLANDVREAVADLDCRWDGRRIRSTVSIGLVTIRGENVSFEEVLSTADSACYAAKERGRNRLYALHPRDAEIAARRYEMSWVSRLQEALDEERLVLFAQRIAAIPEPDPASRAIAAGSLDHWELLLRLRERDGTLVGPMAFIPAAERYNLMPAIDRYIIRAAFRHLKALPAEVGARTAFSINLSGMSLNEEGFLAFVESELNEHGIPAERICFEVTETAALTSLTDTANLIGALKRLGFKFALDDFGSGMSSFGYLRQLPVDFVKIDGSFVKGILADPINRGMVEAIAKLTRIMGIGTVAEYVESDEVLALLAELGVDYAQGYGVHKPEPLADCAPVSPLRQGVA